jgi:hypothetical protein
MYFIASTEVSNNLQKLNLYLLNVSGPLQVLLVFKVLTTKLQLLIISYKCYDFITNVTSLLQILRVYYKCYNFITNVTSLLQMLRVYYKCYNFITNVTSLLPVLQVYYRYITNATSI